MEISFQTQYDYFDFWLREMLNVFRTLDFS